MDSFEKFLEKKNKETEKVNWDARRIKWINSVNEFYLTLTDWLKPYIKQSLLKVTEKEISIIEEHIGRYNLKQLNISVGNDIISLIPRGTLILGSVGRIDMRGPKGEILIIESKWGEWEFVTKINRRERWVINEKSFQSAIQDIVNG